MHGSQGSASWIGETATEAETKLLPMVQDTLPILSCFFSVDFRLRFGHRFANSSSHLRPQDPRRDAQAGPVQQACNSRGACNSSEPIHGTGVRHEAPRQLEVTAQQHRFAANIPGMIF